MTTAPDMNAWLETSSFLWATMRPQDSGFEVFGQGLPPDEFAALVERESETVDRSLVAMALSEDEVEARAIASGLSRDALIALCSRWAHYHDLWTRIRQRGEPHHWVPADPNQIWRAVLLSMATPSPRSEAAIQQLWPDASGASAGRSK